MPLYVNFPDLEAMRSSLRYSNIICTNCIWLARNIQPSSQGECLHYFSWTDLRHFFSFLFATVFHVWPLKFILSSFSNSFLSPFLPHAASISHFSCTEHVLSTLGSGTWGNGETASIKSKSEIGTFHSRD